MKFCTNCGVKLPIEDLPFCPECGADLRDLSKKEKTDEEQKIKEPGENGDSSESGSTPASPSANPFIKPGMSNVTGGVGVPGYDMVGSPGRREFLYSTQGMMFNSGFTIKIQELEGKLYGVYRKTGVSEKDAPRFEVEDSFFDKITEIIDRNNGDSWNGFNKSARDVMDGDSFSFTYSDGKGRRISANGYMAWPEGLGAAIFEIRTMYDEIYDKMYPDLSKQMSAFIRNEVVEEFGNSALSVRPGDPLAAVPLVHGNADGSYNWGENPQEKGVLGYGIFGGYEGKDPKRFGQRAVVVLADKEKTDSVCCPHYTNLKIRYYGLELGEEPKLLEEFLIKQEMIVGNRGEFRIFHFGSWDRTTIGIYRESWFVGLKKKASFGFSALRLTKDKMEDLGGLSVEIPAKDERMNEEVMEAFCKKAEDVGMSFLSTAWGNAWRAKGFIEVPMTSSIFGFYFYSRQYAEVPPNPDGSLEGTPIPDWSVRVFRK